MAWRHQSLVAVSMISHAV